MVKKYICLCKISHSQKYFIPDFSVYFLLFFFLFFSFPFFFFFSVFLSGFSAFFSLSSSRAGNTRANQGAPCRPHAIPGQHRIPGVGPATNARFSVSFALSRARNLQRPTRSPRVSHARGGAAAAECRVGPATRLGLRAFSLSSRARPSHRPITAVRAFTRCQARSRIHSRTNSNVKPISSRGTEAEPKQKGPITRRHVAMAADLKK